MRYLLHSMLIFDVKEGTLSTIDAKQKIKLPYPAVLLLDVFCQNAQVLISRDMLMDKAWVENGFRGSGSTLYNSLSVLRKMFSTLGIEYQAIRTQPKVGFAFELTVKPLAEEKTGTQTLFSNNEGPDKTKPEIKSLSPPAENIQSDQTHTQRNASAVTASFFTCFRLFGLCRSSLTQRYILWILVIITLLAALQLGMSYSRDKNGILPASYDLIANNQQCSLLFLGPFTNLYPALSGTEKIEKLAAKYNIDCKTNKAKFYVHTLGGEHKTNNMLNALIVMCIYNSHDDQLISCFNDYSVSVTQNENKS
ncbi:winged helix-turn-helix domain-containing protein [Enterobacteriaceae bacterium YMB-R22]|jgi:DNA-binding winged helix-turn-helix (wHTH) protein|uniref:winged helix-turn-helix domain-containing protein n=1 Tax=Tenebrionicola larvae TaxID=2815733 RepID=UPI002013AF01|nr:winged helix-turn-helix domain-containing protein [Tenebrionicola larvae]MBV4413721.1 winged helix-turn-helix domain-containing protein [Tenebrionicola larvae]